MTTPNSGKEVEALGSLAEKLLQQCSGSTEIYLRWLKRMELKVEEFKDKVEEFTLLKNSEHE